MATELIELLSVDDLPIGFDYPREFVRVLELGLMDLEPWQILSGDELHETHRGLKDRYPTRTLVPFAARQDMDDVACWDLDRGLPAVSIVHDFASPGWERRAEYADFHGWLRRAVEDLIEW